MKRYHCFLFAAAVLSCGLLAQPRDCQALGESWPWYLRLSSSARASGMGEALVAVGDPSLTYLNPGALGIFSLGHYGAVGYSFHRFGDSDYYFRYQYGNLGFNLKPLKAASPFNLSLGLQYRSQIMDWGEMEGRDENNMPTGPWHNWEGNRALVVAAGLDYGFELGIGLAFGSLVGQLHESGGIAADYPDGNPQDLGIILRMPISNMLRKFRGVETPASSPPNWVFEVIPSFGYASLHQGDGIDYVSPYEGSANAPFPKQNRYGAALEFQLDYQEYSILSLLMAYSRTEHDAEKTADGSEPLRETGVGAELSLVNVLQLRIGWHTLNSAGYYSGSWPLPYYFVPYAEDNRSLGLTFQTDGITRYIYHSSLSTRHPEGSLLAAIMTRASFRFNIAWWDFASRGDYDYRWFEFGLSF